MSRRANAASTNLPVLHQQQLACTSTQYTTMRAMMTKMRTASKPQRLQPSMLMSEPQHDGILTLFPDSACSHVMHGPSLASKVEMDDRQKRCLQHTLDMESNIRRAQYGLPDVPKLGSVGAMHQKLFGGPPAADMPIQLKVRPDQLSGTGSMCEAVFGEPIPHTPDRIGALPFPSTGLIARVPLHPDLEHELYAKPGTGMRRDPVSTRPSFEFKAMLMYSYCEIGTLKLSSGEQQGCVFEPRLMTPLASSKISIVDAYDRYGLAMAYSYLWHAYEHDQSRRLDWLALYVIGSLAVLRPSYACELYSSFLRSEWSETVISLACSVLITELLLLESKRTQNS